MSLPGVSMAIYKEDSSGHQRLRWYLKAGPEGLRSVAQNSFYETVIGQIIRAFCWILPSTSASERNYAVFPSKFGLEAREVGRSVGLARSNVDTHVTFRRDVVPPSSQVERCTDRIPQDQTPPEAYYLTTHSVSKATYHRR
jgi:hypothetical protein